jgi:hypothetical protein
VTVTETSGAAPTGNAAAADGSTASGQGSDSQQQSAPRPSAQPNTGGTQSGSGQLAAVQGNENEEDDDDELLVRVNRLSRYRRVQLICSHGVMTKMRETMTPHSRQPSLRLATLNLPLRQAASLLSSTTVTKRNAMTRTWTTKSDFIGFAQVFG